MSPHSRSPAGRWQQRGDDAAADEAAATVAAGLIEQGHSAEEARSVQTAVVAARRADGTIDGGGIATLIGATHQGLTNL